ncbi:hypothetical protein PN462_20895 [Spirulina sp. CS-785/01]|uniref:hypothetical protein n=1 Tax=Spirulina sp. CS-785/01 TaxID=3021716 RepID=UPI00232E540C|nr:hypothetical protein [Spirulina sp. CS-785/01]MDB9315583.1 hypothetical protein [Spirulina sp. CS-785/01]
MTFTLLRSSAFIREARKNVKKYPQVAEKIEKTLELLRVDPFHPQLRTHKLKGDMKES